MSIEILNRWTNAVIYRADKANTLSEALVAAVAGGANLRGANLRDANLRDANLGDANLGDANLVGANLGGAYLRGAYLGDANLGDANLRDANLRDANLRDANLGDANLGDANLVGANLGGAYLRGAYLRGAYLGGANLGGANLRGAYLPSPGAVLLAFWGPMSDATTLALMRLDASAHPDSTAFDRWAAGGPCPYDGACVDRAANFSERRDLWSPGPPPTLWEAMSMVLDEKCPGWREAKP